MTIAEKLKLIKDNQQKVYEAGYQNGQFDIAVIRYSRTDLAFENKELKKGRTYLLSWYDSNFPGWVTGEASNPTDSRNLIEVTAVEMEISGNKTIGLEIMGRNYVDDSDSTFYKLYQNNNDIYVEPPFRNSEKIDFILFKEA